MTARLLEFLAVILLSSCASFYPVTKTHFNNAPPQIELTPEHGRVDSISLKIRTTDSVDRLVFLEILRSQDGAEPEVIQEILLDESALQRLDEGITVVDSDLEVGTNYQYFISAHGDGIEIFSNVWETTWRNAPSTPSSLASATALGAVTIQWRDEGYGCHVMRRNVLVDNAPTITVAEIPPGIGEWVDTSVNPGDVFTYQIVFVRRNVEGATVWERLGRSTESMYVTVEAL